MASYHVNLATGQTGICKAQPGKCPVQATDGAEHFSNKQEAQKRSEEVLTEKSGIMKSAVKVVDKENEEANKVFSIYTTPITRPVRKTTGGKIHIESCGKARGNSRPVNSTVGKTYAELINKYGDALCQKCFGRAAAVMEEDNRSKKNLA